MSLPELSEQERNWYILKGYEIKETRFYRAWYLNGELYREDGDPIEWSSTFIYPGDIHTKEDYIMWWKKLDLEVAQIR